MFPPLSELLPHRAPMLWLGALQACTETTAVAAAAFEAGSIAVDGGRVLETALVECVAQTAAAAMGWRARAGGGTRVGSGPGMLVAVARFVIHQRPAAEQALRIEIRERKRLGPMQMIEGRITCGGERVAEGELSLYV